MSEPLVLGPSLPSRGEWIEMQQVFRDARGDAHELERRVEARVAELVARPFAIAFGSTGAAIGATLTALGAGFGGEIVLPALAPAVLGAAAHWAGSRCAFADIDPTSLTMREAAAEPRITEATRAIVGVATHGQPAGLEELAALASRNELPLLEIVCGGLGGRIGRDPVGRFGRVAVIGLGADDSTIGSGGAVCVTNDDTLAANLRLLRNLGRAEPTSSWERVGGIHPIERVGFDSRMHPLQAAMADVRLARFEETCNALEGVFHSYLRRLAMHPDLVLPAPCAEGAVRWSHFALRLGERFGSDDRDSIVQGLLRHDIAATRTVSVLPREPAYRKDESHHGYPMADRSADRLIALPFSTALTDRDIDLICQTLQVMIERQSILR
jgi:dTDP-4-amino-4,6-dideoxygalactose transaminase